MPANPRAWLVSAGRFKAIDTMRRRARFDASLGEIAEPDPINRPEPTMRRDENEGVEDDRLRLIFTCCHPALSPGGAGRADAARGVRPDDRGDRPGLPDRRRRRWPSASCAPRRRFATPAFPTRSRRGPTCPSGSTACCRSIYLVFNEGYAASGGDSLTRPDLSGEAIRLGRLLVELLPEPEAIGLLALMLLHESRRAAPHVAATARSILLDDQDRSLWNRAQIAKARRSVQRALSSAPDRRVHDAGRDCGRARRGIRRPPRPTGRRIVGCTTC